MRMKSILCWSYIQIAWGYFSAAAAAVHAETSRYDSHKAKFYWDQFHRNFLVVNVTRKSLTSYGLVTRKLATFRSSRHVKMVWCVANFLVTSRQLVGRVGRMEFGERTTRQADKPAADRRSANHILSAWKLRIVHVKEYGCFGYMFTSFDGV